MHPGGARVKSLDLAGWRPPPDALSMIVLCLDVVVGFLKLPCPETVWFVSYLLGDHTLPLRPWIGVCA
jgi:hypothetical protein